MGKVTFEFDDCEDRSDINVIVNRNKLLVALFELSSYRRTLYKGYETDAVIASGDKILGKITDKIDEKDKDMPTRVLIEKEAILKEIDRILDPVNEILDDCY